MPYCSNNKSVYTNNVGVFLVFVVMCWVSSVFFLFTVLQAAENHIEKMWKTREICERHKFGSEDNFMVTSIQTKHFQLTIDHVI